MGVRARAVRVLEGRSEGSACSTGATGFRLEDSPGYRCYTATKWQLIAGPLVILLEKHH